MLKLFILILLSLSGLSTLQAQLAADCNPQACPQFQEAMDSARVAINNYRYKEAMKIFDASSLAALRYCNMNCEDQVNAEIDMLFKKYIDPAIALAKNAERKQKELLAQVSSMGLSSAYDYRYRGRRFASLSLDDKTKGFVHGDGRLLFRGFVYEEIGGFSNGGRAYSPVYALVKPKGQSNYYWLDTLGQEFVCVYEDTTKLTAESSHVVLSGLKTWPQALFPGTNLRWLELIGEPGKQLSVLDPRLGACRQLKGLNLMDHQISTIPPGFFKAQQSLQYLNFDGNKLKRIEAETLEGLDSLEVLSLEGNELEYIAPTAFRHCPRLKALYLGKNHLKELDPRCFEGLDSLKILSLPANALKQLSAAFYAKLPFLEVLDLQDNPFKKGTSIRLEAAKQVYWGDNYKPQELPTAVWRRLAKSQTEVLAELRASMVWVEGGSFRRGCVPERDSAAGFSCNENEQPAHEVYLDGFYISRYEVSQKQWRAIMGTNPFGFQDCEACPAESVSWYDAQEFIRRLNLLTGERYALPTEAQWEYAARGGVKQENLPFAGAGWTELDSVAWYGKTSRSMIHPVGTKRPNALGLYDMSGNVWERCQDDYNDKYYADLAKGDAKLRRNPLYGGKAGQGSPVLRGGSWNDDPVSCRLAYRHNYYPDSRNLNYGFRLVRLAP